MGGAALSRCPPRGSGIFFNPSCRSATSPPTALRLSEHSGADGGGRGFRRRGVSSGRRGAERVFTPPSAALRTAAWRRPLGSGQKGHVGGGAAAATNERRADH